jgi:hypothetical protein
LTFTHGQAGIHPGLIFLSLGSREEMSSSMRAALGEVGRLAAMQSSPRNRGEPSVRRRPARRFSIETGIGFQGSALRDPLRGFELSASMYRH